MFLQSFLLLLRRSATVLFAESAIKTLDNGLQGCRIYRREAYIRDAPPLSPFRAKSPCQSPRYHPTPLKINKKGSQFLDFLHRLWRKVRANQQARKPLIIKSYWNDKRFCEYYVSLFFSIKAIS